MKKLLEILSNPEKRMPLATLQVVVVVGVVGVVVAGHPAEVRGRAQEDGPGLLPPVY